MQSLHRFLTSMNMSSFLKMYLIEKLPLYRTLILAVFTFFLSCSDRGDDFQTFLEKHDGTEWLLSKNNMDITVYIRLNNYNKKLIEQWSYNSEFDCYAYNPNIFIPGNFEIMENSVKRLVVQCDAVLGPFESMAFSILGDALKVDIIISEWEKETVYFNKSSLNVDYLDICHDQN